MKLNVSEESFDAKWFEFDGAEFKLRPYTTGQGDIVFRDGEIVQSGKSRWEMFDYSLVDWRGVTDQAGKELKMSLEIKQKVFDFALGGISSFVIRKNAEFVLARVEQEKNWQSGQNGS